jgi:hypothetical protein
MKTPLALFNPFEISLTRIFILIFLLLSLTFFSSCKNKSVEEINIENRVNALLTSVSGFDEKSENQMILDSLRVLKISINEIEIDTKNKEDLLQELDKISFKIDSLDKVLYKKIEGVYSHFATGGYESAENLLNVIYDSSLNTLYGTWTFYSNNQPSRVDLWSNGNIRMFKNNGHVILDYNAMYDAFGEKESYFHKSVKTGKFSNPFIYKFVEENGSMSLLQHNVKDPEGIFNGQKLTKINSPKTATKTIEFYRKMFK